MLTIQKQAMTILGKGLNSMIIPSVTKSMAQEKVPKVANSEREMNLEVTIETVSKDEVHQTSDKCFESIGKTKIALSFSVDRLLNYQQNENINKSKKWLGNFSSETDGKCCNGVYSCCSYSSCLVGAQHDIHRTQLNLESKSSSSTSQLSGQHTQAYQDIKSIVRPTPIRALGNSCGSVSVCHPFSSPLLQYQQQQQQQQQQKHNTSHFQRPEHNSNLMAATPLLAPLSGLKSLQINHQTAQHFRHTSSNFNTKAHNIHTSVATTNLCSTSSVSIPQQSQQQQSQPQLLSSSTTHASVAVSNGKRKRSWSRAVFSNLQRKGLEIQFQQQKYITKPDRRKLAARLNLTDAQVKVWFQNRRMKWRHTRENLKSGQEKEIPATEGQQRPQTRDQINRTDEKIELSYSSDGSSSVEMSDNEEDDEIDVVE